jgi:PTH1 family peptidyl-tRNA hydrolase
MGLWNWIWSFFKPKQEIASPMKYLICGLGNPGAEYDMTRHNVGFEVVDKLVKDAGGVYKDERHGMVAEIKHKGRTLIVLKPMTYMNLSGKAVRYWTQKHNIQRDNLLIVLDDLNLDFGTVRLRKNGKDGGHNGLKDIDAMLEHSRYPRLRIGIGSEFGRGQQVDYVLGKWTSEEKKHLPTIIDHVIKTIYSYAVVGVDRAMNQANKKIELK